ncbi:hypothetical protein WEI85_29805 [Actinomycetes bacterium KLBMP 9797]
MEPVAMIMVWNAEREMRATSPGSGLAHLDRLPEGPTAGRPGRRRHWLAAIRRRPLTVSTSS